MWSEREDAIIGGDLTAALAYVTPAGGAVVTPVAPIGLRDRAAGTVGFTTSLGFGRKLDRIKQNPRVALAYHAREHGFANGARLRARAGHRRAMTPAPISGRSKSVVRPASERFMGEPRDRPVLGSLAERLLRRPRARHRAASSAWSPGPTSPCAGRAERGRQRRRRGEQPPSQQPPAQRRRTARRRRRASASACARLPHVLAGFARRRRPARWSCPCAVGAASAAGIALRGPAAAGRAPRRAARAHASSRS